jgi:hypothetical protein
MFDNLDNVDFHQWLYANWWKQKTESMFYNLETQEEISYDDLYKLWKLHQPKTIWFNLYYTEKEGYYVRNVFEDKLGADMEAVGVDSFIKTINLAI